MLNNEAGWNYVALALGLLGIAGCEAGPAIAAPGGQEPAWEAQATEYGNSINIPTPKGRLHRGKPRRSRRLPLFRKEIKRTPLFIKEMAVFPPPSGTQVCFVVAVILFLEWEVSPGQVHFSITRSLLFTQLLKTSLGLDNKTQWPENSQDIWEQSSCRSGVGTADMWVSEGKWLH